MFCAVVGESTIITHKLIQRSLNSYLLNCILAKHIIIRHYKNYINYDLTHGTTTMKKLILAWLRLPIHLARATLFAPHFSQS